MTRRIAAFAVDRLRFGCHLRRLHAASRLFRSISRMSFTALGVPLPGAALGRSADEFNSLAIDCSVQLASRQAVIVAITDCSAGKRTNSWPDRWRANGAPRHCPEWLSRGVKRRRSSNENRQSRPLQSRFTRLEGPRRLAEPLLKTKGRTPAVFELWQPFLSKRIEATAQTRAATGGRS
jgi:hypothetical protein